MEKSLLIGDHLFVSKLSYGPRIPNTPLAFPFTQHTMPVLKTKSYLEWVKWPYKRLAGFRKIKNNDIVVFNFPAGDTVVFEKQNQIYYSIVSSYADQIRQRDLLQDIPVKTKEEYYKLGREQVWSDYHVIDRPVDRRDNYIKRCVGIPGDTIEIRTGNLFVNDIPYQKSKNQQFNYNIQTDGTRINPKAFERLDIAKSDIHSFSNSLYLVPLTDENVKKIKNFRNVVSVTKYYNQPGYFASHIFPHDPKYPWNEDNFGPLWIPKKGVAVSLSMDNLPLYRRIIEVYEKNELRIEGEKIYINGKVADEYTFKMDYYWMMGDNRHDSLDARFWGFVPEDHIVGSPKIIWLSLDKDKKFLGKIRWKRMFMGIK